MKWPAAHERMQQAPDALSVGRGSARPQLPDHAVGNHSNTRKFRASRAADFPSRCKLGRSVTACSGRPFPFLSRPYADDLPHVVASVKPSLVVADEDGNADGTKCRTENLTEKSCQMSL